MILGFVQGHTEDTISIAIMYLHGRKEGFFSHQTDDSIIAEYTAKLTVLFVARRHLFLTLYPIISSAMSQNSNPSNHHAPSPATATAPRLLPVQKYSDTPLARLTDVVNTRSGRGKTRPRTRKQTFHQVVKTYLEEVFTPIAKIIGLTPEATLRMTLNMGVAKMQNMANNTEKPFCGYSPADVFSHASGLPPPKDVFWDIWDMTFLSTLYTEYCDSSHPYLMDKVKKVHVPPRVPLHRGTFERVT